MAFILKYSGYYSLFSVKSYVDENVVKIIFHL